MTYGQYRHSGDGNRGHVRPIAPNESLEDLLKKNRFEFPIHLRTLKVGLYKKLLQADPQLECLRNENGDFFKHAGDYACNRALMMLAGKSKIRYVERDLCIYNTDNQNSVYRTAKESQFETIKRVVAMPPIAAVSNIKPFTTRDTTCKVLLIGMDGADPKITNRLVQLGQLPNMAKAMHKYCSLDVPAGFGNNIFWHSIYSGKLPGENAVYDRFMFARASYKSTESDDTRAMNTSPAFWTELALNGHQVGLFNALEVAPVKGPNITYINDWLVHSQKLDMASSPDSLLSELMANYNIEANLSASLDSRNVEDLASLEKFSEVVFERQAIKSNAYCDLLKRGDWDLFYCSFDALHDLLHNFYHLIDEQDLEAPNLIDQSCASGKIVKAYKLYDEAIGRLMSIAPDATVCLIAGLAIEKNGSRNNDIEKLLKFFCDVNSIALPPAPSTKGLAFSVPSNPNSAAIRINLIGREVEGVVSTEEFDATLIALKEFFLELRIVDSDTPVVSRVIEAAREYPGPYADRLPDLLIEWHSEALSGEVELPGHGRIDLQRRRHISVLDFRTGDHVPRAAVYGNRAFCEKTNLPDQMPSQEMAKVLYDLVSSHEC